MLERKPHAHTASLGLGRLHLGKGVVGRDCGGAGSFREKSSNAFAALEAAVNRSRNEFVAKLAEYRDKLDRGAEAATDGDQWHASLEEAMFVAHRIAGVGKTLGFGELGDAARQAETAISAYKQRLGAVELRAVSCSQIRHLVDLIDEICAEYCDLLD